jgi:hypothetical protein
MIRRINITIIFLITITNLFSAQAVNEFRTISLTSMNFGTVVIGYNYVVSPQGNLTTTNGIILNNSVARSGIIDIVTRNNGINVIQVQFTATSQISTFTYTALGANLSNTTGNTVTATWNGTRRSSNRPWITFNVGATLNTTGLTTSYTGSTITITLTGS